MFQIGDQIIYFWELDNPELYKEGTVTAIKKDLLWIDNQHKLEACIYTAYCWPARVKDQLIKILKERARLKKDYEDSIKLVYQLRNTLSRGEI